MEDSKPEDKAKYVLGIINSKYKGQYFEIPDLKKDAEKLTGDETEEVCHELAKQGKLEVITIGPRKVWRLKH